MNLTDQENKAARQINSATIVYENIPMVRTGSLQPDIPTPTICH